jgi:hypothetical protein
VNNLAIRLGEAGRRGEGLAAAQEATTLYRELVELNRDAYLPALAMSVNNLAVHLAEAGQRKQALVLAREASAHYHDLAQTDHDSFAAAAEQADGLVTALGQDSFSSLLGTRGAIPVDSRPKGSINLSTGTPLVDGFVDSLQLRSSRPNLIVSDRARPGCRSSTKAGAVIFPNGERSKTWTPDASASSVSWAAVSDGAQGCQCGRRRGGG